MRPIVKTLILLAILTVAGTALATDIPDGAVITERIWNDCPTSVITSTNNYSSLISIHEQKQFCGAGWGSRHNWRFASGGIAMNFTNGDGFRFGRDRLDLLRQPFSQGRITDNVKRMSDHLA